MSGKPVRDRSIDDIISDSLEQSERLHKSLRANCLPPLLGLPFLLSADLYKAGERIDDLERNLEEISLKLDAIGIKHEYRRYNVSLRQYIGLPIYSVGQDFPVVIALKAGAIFQTYRFLNNTAKELYQMKHLYEDYKKTQASAALIT